MIFLIVLSLLRPVPAQESELDILYRAMHEVRSNPAYTTTREKAVALAHNLAMKDMYAWVEESIQGFYFTRVAGWVLDPHPNRFSVMPLEHAGEYYSRSRYTRVIPKSEENYALYHLPPCRELDLPVRYGGEVEMCI